ncbi:Uncharacterized iron-regulated protein [Shimia gijangensis]|uniref:Uncharacterized iron-regulated protein n=1 Tax=Shimia gijangensis TaxID=1470563 RepID=A0A1M6FS79_9RHOB|nr:ChaN family lipoprotein [Shimia gijangensis]SHJ00555.1 Uncharacterized iron-regulated protein [Shimia gijangensis]
MRHLIPVLALVASPLFADQIDPSDVSALPSVDVLFLGELHDNPWHHENQTKIVAAVSPKAVVYEMLTPEQADRVSPDLVQDQERLQDVLAWNASGWPNFSLYYPIFRAAPLVSVYGAQVPRADVRDAIMGQDLAIGFGPNAAQYGLTTPLSEQEQAQREAKQFEAHCNALPEEMLPGMVLGQRLRDATLAREIERALAETGGPVVVITGNGHARKDWGAPALLTSDISQRSVAQFELAPKGDQPFDYWVITAEAAREDPCLAFRKD